MDNETLKTMIYYDGIVKGYDALYYDEQKKKIESIKDIFPNFGIMLDLGSGTGIINKYVHDKKNLIVIATDLSFKMLKQNKTFFKIQADALSIPFKNKSFDFITSFSVIQDVLCIDTFLKNTWNILKDNGIFVLSFIKISSKRDNIEKLVEKKFIKIEYLEEEKDVILILKKIIR